MKYLLDTQVLLWAASDAAKLGKRARKLLGDPANELYFSAASIWELTIKAGLGRADFTVDPRVLRRGLLDNGYVELPVTSLHAVGVAGLPLLHKDPVDRMLVSQAIAEGVTLLTSDEGLAEYPGPVRLL